MTLVHNLLENSAIRSPDKVALIHGKVRSTYAEINQTSGSLARYLIHNGVKKGDRVALLVENSLEYVVSYYGVMKAGAVAVPLNADLKPDGLRYAVGDLEASSLIYSPRFENLVTVTDLSDMGVKYLVARSDEWQSATSQESGLLDIRIYPSDLASIVYTSGSTGGPKGVMLSHQNIVDNTLSICQYLCLTETDIQMVVLPFFYVMGKSLLNTHIAVGGTVVINNQFAFPAAVIKEMIAERVTGFSGVPSTFAYLVHRSPLAANREKLKSLRYVSQAGGHMAKAVKEELRRVLPDHTEIVIMYGATEAAARLSYLDPSRFMEKMDSIGKAIPGVTLKVVDENGTEKAAGEIGELVASGSNIMQGYWKNPEATSKVLIDGWYHTGDQVYMDEEGFFFLVGRKDDLLKVGGHRLNPQEIEDVLMESAFFIEVVVLGLPDELLGNKLVVLGVARNEKSTEKEALAYCAGRLPRFKMPSEIRFAKLLPKKSSGKIDRKSCLLSFVEATKGIS